MGFHVLRKLSTRSANARTANFNKRAFGNRWVSCWSPMFWQWKTIAQKLRKEDRRFQTMCPRVTQSVKEGPKIAPRNGANAWNQKHAIRRNEKRQRRPKTNRITIGTLRHLTDTTERHPPHPLTNKKEKSDKDRNEGTSSEQHVLGVHEIDQSVQTI